MKEVDAYIEKAKPFAKPILKHIRKLVHQACPDVEEAIKWNFPHFCYNGILCSMAAFKEHCALTFWKGNSMEDAYKVMDKARSKSMGQFGWITSLEDLPSDKILLNYIKEAMLLNEKKDL